VIRHYLPEMIAKFADSGLTGKTGYFAISSDLQRKTDLRLLSLPATCVNYAVLRHRIFMVKQIRCRNPVVYSAVSFVSARNRAEQKMQSGGNGQAVTPCCHI